MSGKACNGLGGTEFLLNFVRVDDACQVGIGQHGSEELVTLLDDGGISVSSEQFIKVLEGTLGPNDEPTELGSGGQLQEVQPGDVDNFNSWDVSEGLGEFGVLVEVDDEGTLTHSVSLVTELTLTSSHDSGVDNFLDVFEGTETFEEGNGITGLLE